MLRHLQAQRPARPEGSTEMFRTGVRKVPVPILRTPTVCEVIRKTANIKLGAVQKRANLVDRVERQP